MVHAVANALIAKVHKLEAKLQEATNLSNAQRKWRYKAREREKQLKKLLRELRENTGSVYLYGDLKERIEQALKGERK